MTTTALRQKLLDRLDEHPVESWPPHLMRYVLNAMRLEARGELEELCRPRTAEHPVMRIIPDTTGLDLP